MVLPSGRVHINKAPVQVRLGVGCLCRCLPVGESREYASIVNTYTSLHLIPSLLVRKLFTLADRTRKYSCSSSFRYLSCAYSAYTVAWAHLICRLSSSPYMDNNPPLATCDSLICPYRLAKAHVPAPVLQCVLLLVFL
jgi:hypothetical protein